MHQGSFTGVGITNRPSNEMFDQRARLLGYIWSLMMTSVEHRHRHFDDLERIFNPAFRHGFVTVLFNSISEPVAYFVWAFLAPDVEDRLIRTGEIRLHLSEWNEGDQLWILDCAVRPGYFNPELLDHLLQIFPDADTVRYYRKRKTSIQWKEMPRQALERRPTSFD